MPYRFELYIYPDDTHVVTIGRAGDNSETIDEALEAAADSAEVIEFIELPPQLPVAIIDLESDEVVKIEEIEISYEEEGADNAEDSGATTGGEADGETES